MRIEFVNQYGVISNLTTVALPDFAVLIGPNGAGKSHIFRALLTGELAILGIAKEEIQHYDVSSFRPPPSGQANRQTSELTRRLVDAFFVRKSNEPSFSEMSLEVFDEAIGEAGLSGDAEAQGSFVAGLRDEIQRTPRRGVFGLGGSNPYTARLRDRVLIPLAALEPSNDRRNRPRDPKESSYLMLLSAAMRKANKLPHELIREDIADAMHYDDNLVSNLLSEVFSAYKIAQYAWAHRQIEAEGVRTYAELIQQYQSDTPPPWHVMREVLADMREAAGDHALFDFDFTDPEDQELGIDNFELFSFKTDMTNRTTGAMYEPNELSSGEQILMALCMVSFNQILGRRPPQLLLLDEVDAMLHPSMVKALIRTLKTLFVSNGIPVMMNSHSPMTVATLAEGEVFRVNRTGYHVEIGPVTKADAISELSEGLATVDMGLRIAASGESTITILTEGNNARHLKRWAGLYYPDVVRVFEGFEKHTNDEQLLAYGRLLAKVNLNTHFVIVWDCDASKKAATLKTELAADASVTPFAFAHRPENQIATSGIENNYEESVLEPYSMTVTDNDGNLIKRELNGRRKSEFADHVLENGTAEYFIYFQGLADVIDGILQAATSAPTRRQEVTGPTY